jgi:hypothetical protein
VRVWMVGGGAGVLIMVGGDEVGWRF